MYPSCVQEIQRNKIATFVKELPLNYTAEIINKLRAALEILQHAEKGFPETREFIEQNMKKLCEREDIKLDKVIYFVFFV